MQGLWAVVHCGATGRNGTGEGRRHDIGDDRANPLWKRRALQAPRAAASEPGNSTLTATQWEVIEEAAKPLQAAFNELVRQAAWGEVKHS